MVIILTAEKCGGLGAVEQVEISLSADAGGAEQVLDNEDRNLPIHANNQWTSDACFNVDEVIAFGAVVRKTVVFQDADQVFVVHRPKSGHWLLD
ncbi:MAG TPA: hypothetical protein VGL72_03145, partial [Bryobacteraceae bacterium]